MPPASQLAELDGQPQFWLHAEPQTDVPVVYVHGVPTCADEWLAFLDRTGGYAPDLPGMGRSGKRGDGDFTIAGYGAFMERYLDLIGVTRIRLVVQDWGSATLDFAQRFPERIDRLVVINAVPLSLDYRWHRTARIWRTRVLGELAMGSTTPRTLKLLLRERGSVPEHARQGYVDMILAHLDQGSQRAILHLYRSADPPVLAAAGAGLSAITCPSLVIWGDRDPYVPARFADIYAEALGGPVELVHLAAAGHWPWLDDPSLIDRVAAFLGS